MEDTINQGFQTQSTPPQATSISADPKSKKSGSKWLLVFVGLLILGGVGIFIFTKPGEDAMPTPTPNFGVKPLESNETKAPTPTAEPVKKDEVTIEVQNGTGIPGEAAFLQTKLKALGYSEISVGNADTTDYSETTVTFSKTLSQTIQEEIKDELEKIYKTVNSKTSTTQKSDVVIITGLRGTQTSKPLSQQTPKATSSASPSASPKATATP